MRKAVLVGLVCTACVLLQDDPVAASTYNGPLSSYWFPEELAQWEPENDPDALFNKSHVPLEPVRVADGVNGNADKDARLVSLSALNRHTSGVPSQGAPVFYENTFSYWHYTDLMVYWAGSAGEGIIVPPSADVIDAAHRNGVPILGNVFFPPTVYGGQLEWLEQMLEQEDDGSFPLADKLLEVADYYGFDGWFINQETEGADQATAEAMQAFLVYLQEQKPEGMHIMWYDSMIDTGAIAWQNHLTDRNKMYLQNSSTRVADSMFLNFWWRDQRQSNELAQALGRSPYDLYAGVDVEARGTSTPVQWEGLFPEGEKAHTSLGLYRPDWAFQSSETMEAFYEKEQQFWVGSTGNPAKTDSQADWPGMAHWFPAKSTATSVPFVTHFNTGSGTQFVAEGKTVSEQEWNNRSLQDVLPTWRWIQHGGDLEAAFSWEEAFEGGSSLQWHGSLAEGEQAQIELYQTELPISEGTSLTWTYKSEHGNDLKVGFRLDDEKEFRYVEGEQRESINGWTQSTFPLDAFAGQTITGLAFAAEGNETGLAEFYIGQLAVVADSEKPAAPNVKVHQYDPDPSGIQLVWEKQSDVHHYRIYKETKHGKELIGTSAGDRIYLEGLAEESKQNDVRLHVEALSETFVPSDARMIDIKIRSF
ncbi:endo-beta-N-acetylglucosaminidase [Shouchella clausii]|uniref:endo-beta-N-acetylglucosaminidase n=1 Tax=Shouchella clausii TaxID=79880 RepID=UPI000B971B1D|nr:hypothetical protein [Shouchella clausii]AST95176.1 hypothetical protein BC8716_03940 [Shouchella clausii]MCM3549502.1 endo-beta-N-acetylglucosaminidase [Shouchella clausii]MCR1289701.1 endo-beta-N-acetylglucosaminidase [Shouchella clausii]MCY1106291.1 endo-beta-N-acetylglucosaminidase [Shouchella clausii]MEB5471737.1 endo-beta-N-acetylglucosaminidase [Shouchella clausii]